MVRSYIVKILFLASSLVCVSVIFYMLVSYDKSDDTCILDRKHDIDLIRQEYIDSIRYDNNQDETMRLLGLLTDLEKVDCDKDLSYIYVCICIIILFLVTLPCYCERSIKD